MLAALLAAQGSMAVTVYEVKSLNNIIAAAESGLVPGGLTSVTAINKLGDVALKVSDTPPFKPASLLAGAYYALENKAYVLPSLPTAPNNFASGWATAINDQGLYAGFRTGAYTNREGSVVTVAKAFTAQGSTAFEDSGIYLSLNVGLNSQGDLLLSGQQIYTPTSTVTVQYQSGSRATLAPLAGYKDASALSINAQGSVIGLSSGVDARGNRISKATAWYQGAAFTLEGSAQQELTAINDRNWIVGSQLYGSSTEATMWRGGAAIRLGVLPGFSGSTATSINYAGQVLGYSYKFDQFGSRTQLTPFLWDNGKLTDLSTATLQGTGLNTNTKYTWTGGGVINDLGQVGASLKSGSNSTSAAVLTPKAVMGNGEKDSLIILTHGWQPGAKADGGTSMLPAIYGAINTRLSSQINAGQVKVLDHLWSGGLISTDGLSLPSAPTGRLRTALFEAALKKVLPNTVLTWSPLASAAGYGLSYASAVQDGRELGRGLAAYIDSVDQARRAAGNTEGYAPTIHFIGADLGSVVNANAVQTLNDARKNADSQGIQFTVLNTPPYVYENGLSGGNIPPGSSQLFDAKRQVLAKSAAFYYYLALGQGSIKYFDNYYTGVVNPLQGLSGTTFAGQPIPGAGPCVGGGCSGLAFPNHTGYQLLNTLYPNIVAGNDPAHAWLTPALMADGEAYPTSWDPKSAEASLRLVIAALPPAQLEYIKQPLLQFGGGGSILDRIHVLAGEVVAGKTEARSFLKMIAHSPVAFSVDQNVDGQMYLEFDYDLTGGTGGELGVSFGGTMLWAISALDDATEKTGHAVVSLADLAGDGAFIFAYNSELSGSYAQLSDLTLHGLAPVPEASTLASMAMGLALLAFIGRRRALQCLPPAAVR